MKIQIIRLLDAQLVSILNANAADVFATKDQHFRRFPYRTISEMMTLICVTTLRDVLFLYTAGSEVPAQFVSEVRKQERNGRV